MKRKRKRRNFDLKIRTYESGVPRLAKAMEKFLISQYGSRKRYKKEMDRIAKLLTGKEAAE